MPRMRYVKPEFWSDSNMVALSRDARLFFVGCWNFALCDDGHLPDDPVQLKLQILPMDDVDVSALIEELVQAGRLLRVTGPDGRTYLQVKRLSNHQKVDKRWSTKCPMCSHTLNQTPHSTPDHSETQPDSPELSDSLPTSPQEGNRNRRGEKKNQGSSSGARKARGTRISDDFTVSPEMVAWARERVPSVDGKRETEKFINYWIAKSGQAATKVDWVATWKNWMLTAAERAPNRAAAPSGMHPTDANIAAFVQPAQSHLRALPGGEP